MRNLNETVLKFYDSQSEQMHFDEALANFARNELMVVCPVNCFVPFILKRDHGDNTGAITAIADAGGGVSRITAAGHIVVTGGEVDITGTVGYNGTYTAANATSTTFDITAAFAGSETGTWTTGIDNVMFKVYLKETDALAYTYTASTWLTISTGTDYDYLYYDASSLFPANMTPDMYYIVITGWDIKTWYSECIIIRTSTEIATLSRFDFSATARISKLLAGFEQKIYINNRFRTPDYLREDTGDRKDGLMIFEKQIWQKQHKIMLMAHESVVDALMLLPLYDSFTIRKADGNALTVQEITVDDPDWQEDSLGTHAILRIKIIEETIIKKSTFTNMGCPTQEWRAGAFTTEAGVALTVNFTSTLSSTNYTLLVECWETANPLERVWYSFDETPAADKFVIKTLVAATGRYFAVEY
jgi:hypothetical protein